MAISDSEYFGLKKRRPNLDGNAPLDGAPDDQPTEPTAPPPPAPAAAAPAPAPAPMPEAPPVVPQSAPAPIAGVDHNGTTSAGMNREQYRDAWQSSGAKSMADLQAFLQKYGGKLDSDNGTVTTPYGEQIDMLANARGSAAGNGSASAAWTGVGPSVGGPPGGGDDHVPGGPGPGFYGESGASRATGGNSVNDWIVKLLGGPSPTELAANVENDPSVAAYSRVSDRKYGGMRAQAAEESAQGGTSNSGGFAGKIRGLKEDQASDVSSYAGDRARTLMEDRRNEIMQAMQLATQRGQFDQSQALQRELAQLNAEIARRGQDFGQRQFEGQLGYNYDDLQARLNRDALLAALGRA